MIANPQARVWQLAAATAFAAAKHMLSTNPRFLYTLTYLMTITALNIFRNT
jgi:hypothetical protein